MPRSAPVHDIYYVACMFYGRSMTWCVLYAAGLGGQCIFPEFLRTPMSDGSDRVWLTETKYVDNTNLWDTQLEITVFEYEVVARLKYKVVQIVVQIQYSCYCSQSAYSTSRVLDHQNVNIPTNVKPPTYVKRFGHICKNQRHL